VQKVRASWALSTETKAELRRALEWTAVALRAWVLEVNRDRPAAPSIGGVVLRGPAGVPLTYS